MTSTTTEKKANAKLIHAACYWGNDGAYHFLFLRKNEDNRFVWYEEKQDHTEQETEVQARTIEEALRLAARHWKPFAFRTIICGFRYNLPERDEHGINALFHQMVASYSSMNGIYYDEELGNNCFVQNASNEAYQLWKRLEADKKL